MINRHMKDEELVELFAKSGLDVKRSKGKATVPEWQLYKCVARMENYKFTTHAYFALLIVLSVFVVFVEILRMIW